MTYINDGLPIDKWVEYRPPGGLKRQINKEKRRYNKAKHLTEVTTFLLSPKIKDKIDKLIENQIFPDKAEFFRYLIIKFFEDHPTWLR